MSQVIVTFDIIEYLPLEFKFDDFSFIISSESRDFEQEISYLNKNQITHRTNLTKKDLKYAIKVIKNSSLIGISDIVIPSQLLSKRENIFDKECSIAMSDSVKRVLFGSTSSSNYLKVNFHLTLQYKEKEKEKEKNKEKEQTHKSHFLNSNKKPKFSDRSESSGKERLKDPGKTPDPFSQRNLGNNIKNKNLRKHRSNSKQTSNVISSHTVKPKTQIFNNNNNKLIEVQKAILGDEQGGNKNDNSMDEELNKDVKENNPQLINFMKDFNKNNPLDKLNSFNDVNEMKDYSKNIVDQLLNYQLKYYDMFTKTISVKNKLKKIMIQYNQKLRTVKKQINKLDEENDICEIKEEINNKNNYSNIKELFPLKENELDIYKELCDRYLNKSSDNAENNNEEDNENKKIEKAQNLLLKVLTHSINKYGPINKLFTQTNSTEPERINMRKLANKFNLPLNTPNEENKNNEVVNDNLNDEKKNEENINNEKAEKDSGNNAINKWEYVLTEKPDKIDKKLEEYLKYFYSKRTFAKVPFKKTSTNNYEYGTQKVMVKIEGDTIRIRYVGGYLLIDKFIELNSATEEKKMKKQNEKQNNATSSTGKKKDGRKNK